jgi:hypothetical protein
MTRTRGLLALVLVATLAPAAAYATELSATTVADLVSQAQMLERTGKVDEALERLKSARSDDPSSEPLVIALANAYLVDKNPFWALNVLVEYASTYPPGCQARAWAAWVQIQQANLDEADELLDAPECSARPELAARLLLLRALVAHHRHRPSEVTALLARARSAGTFYAEDRDLLDDLTSRYDPGREPFASWKLDAAVGFTTNGLAGAPVDARSKADAESMVVLAGAQLRLVGWNSAPMRPLVEGQIRAQHLTSESDRDYSYRLFSVRPGVLFGRALPRLELRYAAEAVELAGGDRYASGPIWYSESHRLEYDIAATRALSVFGGAGHRAIRDRARTRFELDEGLAWVEPISPRMNVILGASARWYIARASAYSEVGSTVLAQSDLRATEALTVRANLALSGDAYPGSEGYFSSARGRERRELLLKGGIGLWWPATSALRGGLEYTFARRHSTAADYSYVDHRFLLRLQWASDSGLFSTVIPRDGRTALETGTGNATGLSRDASVRELLRQDEAAQRSSSCLK